MSSTAAYLPLELCEADLLAFVETCGPVPEPLAATLFAHVVSGLRHCHALGLHHGDVKPENVLMGFDGVPRVADFGSATTNAFTRRPCATILYGSPEGVAAFHAACEGESVRPYDAAAADVWSLGVTMAATLTGFMPWEVAHTSDRRYGAWARACKGPAEGVLELGGRLVFGDDWKDRVSPECVDLLCGMLQPDAARRPTLATIATHPWFTGVGRAAAAAAAAGVATVTP